MIAPLSARLALALLTTAPASNPPPGSHGPAADPAAASADEADPAATPAPADRDSTDERRPPRRARPLPERPFMLGLEGLVIQAPPLRPEVVRFDPRFVGRSVAMGGLGLFARLRVHPRIAVETSVRSGSVRYAGRDDEDGDVVSQDQVMADAGVLLFVAQGEIAQLAFDAGVGGMGTRVKYELDREGTQLFGAGLVRVGADAEFRIKRIAFVVSVRAYGVFTPLDGGRSRGPLLAGKSLPAPVPALETLLVASAGVAYRF